MTNSLTILALLFSISMSPGLNVSAQETKEFRVNRDVFYPELTANGRFNADGKLAGDLMLYAPNGELAMRETYSHDGSWMKKRIVYWPKSRAGQELTPMWVNNWDTKGNENAIYYRPNGNLYSKKTCIKNQSRNSATDKLYDYTQEFFYETEARSSRFEGYVDSQGKFVTHGMVRSFTPTGIQYATARFYQGKQSSRTIDRNVESRLSASERSIMQQNMDEKKYNLIPKVTWERALRINDHAGIAGR